MVSHESFRPVWLDRGSSDGFTKFVLSTVTLVVFIELKNLLLPSSAPSLKLLGNIASDPHLYSILPCLRKPRETVEQAKVCSTVMKRTNCIPQTGYFTSHFS